MRFARREASDGLVMSMPIRGELSDTTGARSDELLGWRVGPSGVVVVVIVTLDDGTDVAQPASATRPA